MKRKLKMTFSGLLAVVMMFTMVATLDFSAFATGVDQPATEVEATENQDATEATSPSEEAPTQAPTEEPTEEPTSPSVPSLVIGQVKNLVKVGGYTNKIVLKWDKVKGADGYYVYYCNIDKSRTYKRYADVKSNSCTITGLSHTTPYYVKVAAYTDSLGIRQEGMAAAKRTATQPAQISKIALNSSTNSAIKFTWTRNSKATGYKIYRASASTGGKYVAYKTIKGYNNNSFTDKNITKNKAYYYRVRAYRTMPYSTYHSEIKSIKTVCGLHLSDFKMTSQLKRVSFSWKKVSGAKGYEIYYSTSKNGTYTRLASTTKDFYNSKHLSVGKTYYFRIRPYKYVGSNKAKVVGSFVTKAKKVSDKGYGVDVGKTYIEISLKQQHMWFYYNGKLYCETDVVTGNNDGYHNTPKGTYKIFQRVRSTNLVGAGYVSYVDYWLGFTHTGIGIHDASWRSNGEYGGTTYKGNGSHGCVNTPLKAVKKIYSKARIGDEVVVY